mmetsp:Transcript_32131/g.81519  ORF Transcript_32131/g.81519 Transcript_32131/m.81519 type:complete len:444 (+) Transcript_32131:128-1459(+)
MEIPYFVKIGISIVVYCLSVSAVPIYNKFVFSGVSGPNAIGLSSQQGLKNYPFPIATAFLQLFSVAVVLAFVCIIRHICCRRQGKSWLFGPHFRYKLRHIAPVGLLFGLKYGITNWGLQLVPVGMHLLLQSSDLMWTVLTARLLNRETAGVLEYVSAVLSSVGSIMIAMYAVDTLSAPFVPLLVNLLTPLVLALCISFLRLGTQELLRCDNRLQGTMTSTEFTALKLLLSAAVALVLAMLLEGRSSLLQDGSWWEALGEEPTESVAAILFGGVFVLIFQVNLTWLAGLTSALTVGIIGGLKVVPQWFLNAAFHLKVNLTPLNLLGAGFILAASVLYAITSCSDFQLVYEPSGFVWQPKVAADCMGEPLLEADRTPSTHGNSGLGPDMKALTLTLSRPAAFFDVADASYFSVPPASLRHICDGDTPNGAGGESPSRGRRRSQSV